MPPDERYLIVILKFYFGILSPRSRKILKMKICDRMTHEEIGRHLGVNRETVRRIEVKALKDCVEYIDEINNII